jgi:hypothetical protein
MDEKTLDKIKQKVKKLREEIRLSHDFFELSLGTYRKLDQDLCDILELLESDEKEKEKLKFSSLYAE